MRPFCIVEVQIFRNGLLYAMQQIDRQTGSFRHSLSVAGMVAAVSVAALELPDIPHEARLNHARTTKESTQAVATTIDTILDDCSVNRNLFLGGNGSQPYGLTKHSPIGPLFLQYPYWFSDDRTEFREEMLKSINQAEILVMQQLEMGTLTHT